MNRTITQIFCFLWVTIITLFLMNILYQETYGEPMIKIEKKYVQRIYITDYNYNITNKEYNNITNNEISPRFTELIGRDLTCITSNGVRDCY